MSLANRFRTVSRRSPESESWPVRRGRGEAGDDVTPSRPVWRVPTDDDSTVPSAVNRTLAELRDAAVEAAWPSRNLALRAARLATDGAVYPLLLRIADKQYLRAARLWLQIASYLDDDDEVVTSLRLAAQCARIGGNKSFADNCFRRMAAAERLRLLHRSTGDAVGA
jgi:hypothetical protein